MPTVQAAGLWRERAREAKINIRAGSFEERSHTTQQFRENQAATQAVACSLPAPPIDAKPA